MTHLTVKNLKFVMVQESLNPIYQIWMMPKMLLSCFFGENLSHFNTQDYEILTKKNTIKMPKNSNLLCVFVIQKFQNYVFVHDFLSNETLELLEILNSSKRLTNLKCDEDRFSKFEYLDFLRPFFDFFVVFSFFNENLSYLKTQD